MASRELLVALELAGEARDGGEQAGKDDAADPELGAATNAVVGGRTSNGTSAGNDGVHEGEQQAALRRGDAEQLVHGGQVVGQDGVAGELGKDGHEGHHGEAPAGVVGVDEGPVVPDGGSLLQLDAVLELLQLKLDHGVVGVAAAVVLGEDGRGLLLLAPHGEPSRRLGDEEDARADDQRRRDLQGEGQTEGNLALGLAAGIGDTSGQDGAGVED